MKKLKIKYAAAIGLVLLLAAVVRFYRLGSHTSPYWEEAALGYDAYSIWKTGRDHHGHRLPIVAFESFGDWKPSLYFYAASPFVGLLGLNTFSVRLPSAICGVMIVLGVGLLTKLVYEHIRDQSDLKRLDKFTPFQVQITAMLLTAINPWAVHFSRAAWEVNLAACLTLWGVWFGLRFVFKQKKIVNLASSALLLILSLYAYHAMRIIAPLLGLGIVLLLMIRSGFNRVVKQHGLKLVVLLAAAAVLVWPVVVQLNSNQISQRFQETSLFSQIEVIERSNNYRRLSDNSVRSRIFYHRYLLFGREIISNFLVHFNLDFLFVSGDANPRHSIQYYGHFYHLEFILLLLGTAFLVGKRTPIKWFFGFWLTAGIVPAALTKTTPHALRILPTLPVFIAAITLGLLVLLSWLKTVIIQAANKLNLCLSKKAVGAAVVLVLLACYLLEFLGYAHYYLLIYPDKYASDWQSGYQQMIKQVVSLQRQHPQYQVYISRSQGRPAMYYWFFTKTNPKQVQAAADSVKKDQGEFLEYQQIQFQEPTGQPQSINAVYTEQGWKVYTNP